MVKMIENGEEMRED